MSGCARAAWRRRGVARATLAALAIAVVVACEPAPAQVASPEPWADAIAQFERDTHDHPPPPDGVVFIGSSSIRRWETLSRDFPGIAVVNRGFGGSKIADATRYADRIVTPLKPRGIVLYAGDNDLAYGATPAAVEAGFERFVAAVRRGSPAAWIVFVSVKPSPARHALLDAMRQANALVRAFVARRADLRYVDVFTPMLDDAGAPRAELFGPDGLHMNSVGYALWASTIAPALHD